MRLSDYRLKFAELKGPWTNDPPNKKNQFDQVSFLKDSMRYRVK